MVPFSDFRSPRIFPAIDIRGGRCIRLVQGARDAEIEYDEDPVRVARRWAGAGAECLHVIDLGAAFGEEHSRRVVLQIAHEVGLPMQVGGGLRTAHAVSELLDGGVSRVILGTAAFRDEGFLRRQLEDYGPRRVVVAVDCRGEKVKIGGWEEDSQLSVEAALEWMESHGVEHFLVTATERDGTLSGPRIDLVERVLERSKGRVVAAGGIGKLKHIQDLLDIAHPRLEGVVVGRALYEGTVGLREALDLTARED